MSRKSAQLLKAFLDTLHYSGAANALEPLTGGRGAIFMLHHVTPEPAGDFEPNRILKVTPEFLDAVIVGVKARGFDIVSLDELPKRLAQPNGRRFVCFTLDDGYRDNLVHAYPVFRRHDAPFAIYVPGHYPEGAGDLWWLTLEAVIAKAVRVDAPVDGPMRTFEASLPGEKYATFHEIYWWLRSLDERDARREVAALARRAGLDPSGQCRRLVMTWDEIRALAADPLVTIGAHTMGHWALAKLPFDAAEREIRDSVAVIEKELGRPCRHFSYPYGCEQSAGAREFEIAAKAGLLTAVTTRKGLLKAEHAAALTALPRLSLNGDYQHVRYVEALLTGAPFALYDAARALRAAAGRLRPAA